MAGQSFRWREEPAAGYMAPVAPQWAVSSTRSETHSTGMPTCMSLGFVQVYTYKKRHTSQIHSW